jgi:hypothetical protein
MKKKQRIKDEDFLYYLLLHGKAKRYDFQKELYAHGDPSKALYYYGATDRRLNKLIKRGYITKQGEYYVLTAQGRMECRQRGLFPAGKVGEMLKSIWRHAHPPIKPHQLKICEDNLSEEVIEASEEILLKYSKAFPKIPILGGTRILLRAPGNLYFALMLYKFDKKKFERACSLTKKPLFKRRRRLLKDLKQKLIAYQTASGKDVEDRFDALITWLESVKDNIPEFQFWRAAAYLMSGTVASCSITGAFQKPEDYQKYIDLMEDVLKLLMEISIQNVGLQQDI